MSRSQADRHLATSFDSFYAKLKESIMKPYFDNDDDKNNNKDLKVAAKHLESACDYNVPHGKKLRGLCTYQSYLILSQGSAQDMHETAMALGWCIELLQASFLIADDIMDNSKTRRGKPCWYLNDQIGNMAINDSFFLLFAINQVIKRYLSNHRMYARFYELFNETSMRTCIGQSLDLITGISAIDTDGHFDPHQYTQNRYNEIVIWKTAYYSFYLPVACALYLANIDDVQVHATVKRILLQMGHFFQVQDDFLDCYGDPTITGKIGTDIEECKCSWLFVKALEQCACSPDDLDLLKKNYGRRDQACVNIVKDIYARLHLDVQYRQYEAQQYTAIMDEISGIQFAEQHAQVEIKELLVAYVHKIFKRNA